jgi:SWI/SNF-related matrix-associated actin-dependent regulator of chromatin subfamily A-like protein 1
LAERIPGNRKQEIFSQGAEAGGGGKMSEIILTHTGNQFYFSSLPFEKKDIAKKAGFSWNPDRRHWYTSDVDIAEKCRYYADESAISAIDSGRNKKTVEIESSRATDSSINIPVPENLSYLPYQRAGIAYAIDHKNCLIADEMGLGKTIQAIGLINAIPDIKNILVICPATLKLNWKREMEKWFVRPLKIEIANGDIPETDVLICNYDILKKHADALRSKTWDLMICDESHYLKNQKAQRTQLVFGGKEIKPILANRKIFLTGTPVLNRPIELHPLLRALNVEFAQNWTYYVKRYCNGSQTRWGWDVSGASHTDELGEKLRTSVMIRREKSQVLSELPAKTHQLITLSQNGCAAQIAKEQKAWIEHEEKTKELKANLAEMHKTGKTNTEEYRAAVQELRQAAMAGFTEISKLRHETAVKKIPHTVEIVSDAVESQGSVVVFAHHTDVLDGIIDGLRQAGHTAEKIDGSVPMEKRQQIVDDFQAGKINVFVGGFKAAGVGITLTRSSHVIFAELDWTPATIAQAEDRCHRIGQTNNVLVQHVVFDGSIDAMLAKKLIEKEEIIESIME